MILRCGCHRNLRSRAIEFGWTSNVSEGVTTSGARATECFGTVKQIVVFTENASKPGEKKELAIGAIVAARINVPRFSILSRVVYVSSSDHHTAFYLGH